MGSDKALHSFPEQARRKVPSITPGAGGIHQDHVHIAPHAAVLKSIVGHHHVAPPLGQQGHPLPPVRRHADRTGAELGGKE